SVLRLANSGSTAAKFHWIRKAFQAVAGLEPPPAIFTHEDPHLISAMPDTAGRWGTTRFVDPAAVRYDMHVTIVTLEP
ncbi:(S)-ureidoglycine aminohydrolase, partial [Rhizobium ruizarguesonis]